MKLLFDQNLSHRLVAALADIYPDSIHVRDAGMASADDNKIWEYARNQGLFGAPPKVIWIQKGNCTTSQIEDILSRHRADLQHFFNDPDATFLALE